MWKKVVLSMVLSGCYPIINIDAPGDDSTDGSTSTDADSDADASDTTTDADADADADADSDADGDVDTDGSTTTTPEECDHTESVVDGVCVTDLCGMCDEGVASCPDFTTLVDTIDLCGEPDTTQYSCCNVVQCTTASGGDVYDLVACNQAYGSDNWYFDPATGALVSRRLSTDLNEFCDYASFSIFYGLDLSDCSP